MMINNPQNKHDAIEFLIEAISKVTRSRVWEASKLEEIKKT